MGYKINIYSGTEWYNILNHDYLENIKGSSEGYHLSYEQHSWLDQDISKGKSPAFYNDNMSGDISVWNNNKNYITANDASLNIFTQSTPSSEWNINHNFGTKYVMIQVYGDDDIQINPDSIELTDNNNVKILFDTTVTGYVLYSKLTGTAPSSNPAADHGSLTGLLSDDHTQYSLVDGTRGFTGPISGVDPTISSHLTTKFYVDNKTWLSSKISDFDNAVENNSAVLSNSLHRISDGSDHAFIDQDVTVGSAPQFSNTNMYGPNSIWTNDSNFITSSSVTYEILDSNGDIGVGSDQVSRGDHNHENLFYALNVSGGINISNGWTDLTFDTVDINDSYYTLIGDKEVKISKSGLYSVRYDISSIISNYVDDSDTMVKVLKDTGSGYISLNGSFSTQSNGSYNSGVSSMSKEILVSLSIDDKVKIQAERSSGSSTIETYQNSCTFLIKFLR